jgi:hypothetical protein
MSGIYLEVIKKFIYIYIQLLRLGPRNFDSGGLHELILKTARIQNTRAILIYRRHRIYFRRIYKIDLLLSNL